MFQPQDIVTLIETAHASMREDLLKVLPAEQRHTGLMVANALSMAQRYLQAAIEAGAVTSPLDDASALTHAALVARNRQELQIANPKRL